LQEPSHQNSYQSISGVAGSHSEHGGRTELLAIRLRIENLSETRKVEYRGWGRVSSFPDIQIPILKDNFGNR
jgi:hypothetical protein